MSLEVVGGWLAKLGWTTMIPYLVWSHKRDKTKLDATLSKKETGELIDLKIAPLEQKSDNQAQGLHDKFDLLLNIVKSDNDKNTAQRKDNNDMLHNINTNVAVIKNEVDNLKERFDKQQ